LFGLHVKTEMRIFNVNYNQPVRVVDNYYNSIISVFTVTVGAAAAY